MEELKEKFTDDFLYIFLSVFDVSSSQENEKRFRVIEITSATRSRCEGKNTLIHYNFLVMITWRKYLFPYRTQKSSSNVPTIFVGYPAEKIGCRQVFLF